MAEVPIQQTDHSVTTVSEGPIFPTVNMEACAALGMVTTTQAMPSFMTKPTPSSTATLSTMNKEMEVDTEPPSQR